MQVKKSKRIRRHKRIRAKIKGTAKIPRICLFKSNRYFYASLVDDDKGATIALVKSSEIKLDGKTGKTLSFIMGELLADKAKAKKISKAVFDKSGYKYHGKIQMLADGARKAGLKFVTRSKKEKPGSQIQNSILISTLNLVL